MIRDSQRKCTKKQSETNKKHFGDPVHIWAKAKDLAFADDVAILENTAVKAQKQLDAYKENAAKVGLRLDNQKDRANATEPTKRR